MDSEIKQLRQQKITTVMLEPIREVLESDESDVIHYGRLILWKAPDVEA
jgi:hypothetical protein